MKRALAFGSALLIGIAGLGLTPSASAAGGGEAIAVSSLGRVAMTAQDGSFDGNTARIPLKFTYERWGNDYGDVGIQVTSLAGKQVGASGDIGFLTDSVGWSFGAAQKGTGDAILEVSGSSFIPNQPMLIYGAVQFTDYRTREEVEVALQPVLIVSVARETTTMQSLAVGRNSVTGRATVETRFGTSGADGRIQVRYRAPGDKQWTPVQGFVDCPDDICLDVDPLGNFSATTIDPIPANARVEVSVTNCGWCTDVKATVTRGNK